MRLCVGFHEIPGHPDNAAEEGVCIRIAALNLHERVFPFRSHCGRRDLFRQNTDEVAAVLRGNEGFALALCKAGLHQFFNDSGAGRGCSKTFLLGVIIKLIVSGSLHRRQERVFRVLLRGCREVFGDAGRYTIQSIALMDFGQGLHGIILFFRLEGCLEQLFNGFPAVLNDGLALGFERIALAGERDLRFCVGVLLAGRTQKAHPDKIEDFLLRLRKRRNILLFELDGRENSVVICDLAVVGHAGNVRSDRNAGEKRKLTADDGNDLTGSVLHIVRDELTVRAWIGQELLFVKRLNEIECLLGSEAVVSVCLALQGGQIVELRRIDGFRLPLERRNDGLLFLASRRNSFCFLFGFDLFQIGGQIALADVDVEILFLLERGDFPVTLHQHCKGRRLDAPDHQLLVIA